MTAISILPLETDGHIETALPWYVNGTLPEVERAAVELHLSQCERCRASHHLEVLLQRQVRTSGDALENTQQLGWAALSNKLTAPAMAMSALPMRSAMPRRRGRTARRRVRRYFTALLLLAQAGAIAALAFALANVLNYKNTASYTTLTDSPRLDATIPTLRIVFADEVTSARIRELLAEIGGSIAAGPGASNVYTVQLVRTPIARESDLDETAKWLRSQSGVRFAEAVYLPGQN